MSLARGAAVFMMMTTRIASFTPKEKEVQEYIQEQQYRIQPYDDARK